jgi:predicted NBD/HSP70 family sugar kinase
VTVEQVVGLDVSVKETHICVVDGSGAVVARSREATHPELFAALPGKLAPAARVVPGISRNAGTHGTQAGSVARLSFS